MRIVLVHREIHTVRHNALHRGQEVVNRRTNLRRILRRKRRKDMIDDRPSCGRSSDADAHARKVLAAHMGEDGLDAVMSTRAAFFPYTHRPCGDIHIIVNNDEIIRIHFIVGKHRTECLAAVVHIS